MGASGRATPVVDHGWIRYGRARLNLTMRLSARAHSVLSVGGAAKGPLRLGVAAASTAADLALARRLARSDRPELALHAGVNLVDLATWTALGTRPGPEQLSTAMTPGHPLAIEVGARHGWAGMLVPVAGIAVSSAVGKARGRPTQPAAFVWQVAAAAGGAGLARYVGGLRGRRLQAHEVELQAQLERADLEGRNQVALGVDNLIDEIQRAGVLIQLGAGAPAGGAGAWKADVAEQTRRSHRYLVDVLVEWQRRHNDTTDLASVAALDLDPGLAPVILDDAAATTLIGWLDGLDLRGRHAVAAADRSIDPASPHLLLRVGRHHLDLDTGVAPVRLHVDPLPGGLAWLALWLAAAGAQDGVPAAAALGPAAAALALMVWVDRAGRAADAAPAAVPAVVGSTVISVVAAVVQTALVTSPRTDPAIPRIPASLSLRGLAFVTALAAPDVPPPVVGFALVGGAVAFGASWLLTPAPRPVREFLAELSWVSSALMASAFTKGIARDAEDLEAMVAIDDEQRRHAAAMAGRRAAIEHVDAALAEAVAMYAEHGHVLEPPVSEEARRRLQVCAERLQTLRAGDVQPAPS